MYVHDVSSRRVVGGSLRGQARVAHGPVGHHHGVGVSGEEHGLRVDRGPELGHLRVAAHAAHVAHAHGALAAREVLHTWNNGEGLEREEWQLLIII